MTDHPQPEDVHGYDQHLDSLSAQGGLDPYHEALLRVNARVMTFGGFQRTEHGEFWISRDDVRRCIDEELEEASRVAAR